MGRAGRFGTKGLAINFIRADEEENEEGGTDKGILMDVQNGFKVKISELPKELDTSLYMWSVWSNELDFFKDGMANCGLILSNSLIKLSLYLLHKD